MTAKKTTDKPAAKKPAAKKKTAVRFEEQLEALNRDVENANAKAEDNWNKALRALAELENVKRRAEADVTSAHKYALEKFINGMLPVIDSLEQAMIQNVEHESAKPLREGIELTLKMFADTLGRFGVEQLDPVGEPFDAEKHEAMSMQPNAEVDSGTVLLVYQKGYVLNGRLVRPARVVVSQ
jgi:molecular chaperone GrpE